MKIVLLLIFVWSQEVNCLQFKCSLNEEVDHFKDEINELKSLSTEEDDDGKDEEYELNNTIACDDLFSGINETGIFVFQNKISKVQSKFARKLQKRSIFSPEQIRCRWHEGIIPYHLHASQMSEINVTNVKEAMLILAEASCLKFVEFTNETDYVNITTKEDLEDHDHTCNMDYIPTGGVQVMSMADCEGVSDIVHELMHGLGFIHEHMRPDRDDHVHVLWDKIPVDQWSQYCKLPAEFVDTFGMPYDLHSLLHYDDEFMDVRDEEGEIIELDKPTQLSDNDKVQLKKLFC